MEILQKNFKKGFKKKLINFFSNFFFNFLKEIRKMKLWKMFEKF